MDNDVTVSSLRFGIGAEPGSERLERAGAVLDSAIERTDFQLTYERSKMRREFYEDGITGPTIADAFAPEDDTGRRASGDWSAGGKWSVWMKDFEAPEEEWIERFFTVALQEAVHEVCEWFKVDGQTYLSPHDPRFEDDILIRSAELAEQLIYMARVGRDTATPED